MTAESECSTSGRQEASRFSGGSGRGPLVRKVQPKRFIRQQVNGSKHMSSVVFCVVYANDKACLSLQVPDEILLNDALNSAIAVLPANYSFEVR